MGLFRICAVVAAALLRDREGDVRGAAGTGQRSDQGAAGRVGNGGMQAENEKRGGGGWGGRRLRRQGVGVSSVEAASQLTSAVDAERERERERERS
jgi:hypothetical protein